MKKFLLSLVGLTLGLTGFVAHSAEVTFDLKTSTYGIPNQIAGTDNTDYITVPATMTNGNVTIQLTSNADGWRFWNDGLRVFKNKNAVFTVSTNNGGKITEVSYTGTATFDGISTSSSWKGNESSVSFPCNVTATKNIQTIKVVYEDGQGGGTVTPDPSDPDGDTVETFDFKTNSYGLSPTYNGSSTGYITTENVASQDFVTITFEGDAQSWRMWSDGIRAYKNKNASFTVAAKTGYKLTNIQLTTDGTYKILGYQDDANVKEWSGEAKSVKFTYTLNDNKAISNIVVTYAQGESSNTVGTESGTVTPEQPTPGGDEEIALFYAQGANITDVDNNDSMELPSGNIAGNNISFTAGDVTITITPSSSNISQVSNNQIRWYKNDVLTVTPSNGAVITGFAVYGATDSSYNSAFSSSKGTVSGPTDGVITWTGSTNEPLELKASGSQIRCSYITVTYIPGAPAEVNSPKISFDKYTNTVTITSEEGTTVYYTTDGQDPTSSSTKYTAPFTISETLTVKAFAEKDGKFSNIVSNTCAYYPTYSGFSALAAAGQNAEGKVDGPITVIYQNGQYLYVKDSENDYMLVYGSLNETLSNGDVLSYVAGKYTIYNSLPELANPILGEITTGGAMVEPEEVSLSQVTTEILNSYVKLTGVEVNGLEMTEGEDKVALYNRFTGVTLPETAGLYNVVGFVSIFNSTLQVYPISFEEYVAPVYDIYINGGFNKDDVESEEWMLSQGDAEDGEENLYEGYFEIPADDFSLNFKYGNKYLVPVSKTNTVVEFTGNSCTLDLVEDADGAEIYWTYSSWTGGELGVLIDLTAQTVTFQYTPEQADVWYIRGAFNDYDPQGEATWALNPVEGENGVYTGTFNAPAGEFSFNLLDPYGTIFIPYNIATEEIVFEPTEDDMVEYTGKMDSAVEEDEEALYWTYESWGGGEFTVTIDSNEGEITITASEESTAINSLNKLGTDDVIYNLQGLKVNNPAKGQIYIINGKKAILK